MFWAHEAPRRGFTLIEILVVIVVIGALAALVAPNVFRHVSTSKQAAARTQVEMLAAALDAYRLDNDVYPTTGQGLEALRREPTAEPVPSAWSGPYLRKEVPVDPWGRPFAYEAPGSRSGWGFDLYSFGRDGTGGGEGEDADILGWQ